jgi:hypothetical protein
VTTSRQSTRAPGPLLAAAALVGVEAVVLAGYGLVQLTALTASRATMGVTTTVFFVGYGVALGVFAWALRRPVSWARAPVVLAQLIQLGVAWSFRGGSTTVVAVPTAVLALLVLAGIFHPASLAALADDEPGPA